MAVAERSYSYLLFYSCGTLVFRVGDISKERFVTHDLHKAPYASVLPYFLLVRPLEHLLNTRLVQVAIISRFAQGNAMVGLMFDILMTTFM